MNNFWAAGVTPLFGLFIEEWGISINQAAVIPSYTVLALGLSNVYALPLCAYIGKRYTIVISMAVFLAANIWAAKAESYNSLIATRIIGGLGGGMAVSTGICLPGRLIRWGTMAGIQWALYLLVIPALFLP